jgi:hypothetical protein
MPWPSSPAERSSSLFPGPKYLSLPTVRALVVRLQFQIGPSKGRVAKLQRKGAGSDQVNQLVDQSGFEPPTSPVRGVRSTRLSYWPKNVSS